MRGSHQVWMDQLPFALHHGSLLRIHPKLAADHSAETGRDGYPQRRLFGKIGSKKSTMFVVKLLAIHLQDMVRSLICLRDPMECSCTPLPRTRTHCQELRVAQQPYIP